MQKDDCFDFKALRKEYKKLKCPSDRYNPSLLPLESAKYFFICSSRSCGKTTNVILLGMLANKLDGTEIQYIRENDAMLAPKNSQDLMRTILTHGYIEKISDNEYNSAIYKSRRWYYIKYNDEGEVIKKAKKPFMVCLSVDNNEIYKSSYNAPYGDFIILDEAISRYYRKNLFVDFSDLTKTIIRERKKPLIFLLANTIDREAELFYEYEIAETVQKMPMGSHEIIRTEKGTSIYLELYSDTTIKKTLINTLFFGFKNKQLGSITGEDWAITPAPRMNGKPREIISKNRFLEYESNILQLEIIIDNKRGLCVYAHRANKPYDNSVIFTTQEKLDKRYRHRYGYDAVDQIIWTLYDRDKFLYGTNNDKAIVDKYVKRCQL